MHAPSRLSMSACVIALTIAAGCYDWERPVDDAAFGSADASRRDASADASDAAATLPDGSCSPSWPCRGAGEFCDYADDQCGEGSAARLQAASREWSGTSWRRLR